MNLEKKLIPGSVIGGMLLVSGSCIGAGMLALPILSGIVGYFPALILFLITYVFMTYTGLLLIEVNGWFYGQVNIISMAEKSFGKFGKISSWFLYLILFYSLIVAYLSGSGQIIHHFILKVANLDVAPNIISVFLAIVLGVFIYFGTKPVDFFNRILMFGLIVAYIAMISLGLSKINLSYLTHTNYKYLMIPLSVLITSFGFHNMIPSLTAYMRGDLKRMKITIIGGSTIALVVYLLWETFVLGVVPYGGDYGLLNSYFKDTEAAMAVSRFVKSPLIITFSQSFAFFAIITSLLAQSLSVMHFIADGIKKIPDKKNSWYLALLALAPPVVFAYIYPQIFFAALSFAGGFCAVILFGVFPALMTWIGRYHKKYTSSYHVSGGKFALVLVIAYSLLILFREIFLLFK
jgi:tyrosine-specific transport protein